MVLYYGNYYSDVVRKQKSTEVANYFFNQMSVDASAARMQAKTSEDPLSIYSEFLYKCNKRLNEVGAKLIDVS
jgi:hypothetical protein